MKNLGRIDQSFRGHASAKDAQTTQFFCIINHSHLGTQFICRSRRRITGATTANDDKIVGLAYIHKAECFLPGFLFFVQPMYSPFIKPLALRMIRKMLAADLFDQLEALPFHLS